MIFSDIAYQHFDWWHDKVPGAFITNTEEEENFNHYGSFFNKAINLGFTIGLNDYWNVTLSQLFSERCMDWDGPTINGESATVHHRTECTSSSFYDGDKRIAFGGFSGDARLNFRYLLFNQGKGPGNRLFLGLGFDIPSSNVITESPWKKNDHDNNPTTDPRYTPHRHFYLSDGAYKLNLEFQYFKKRFKYPVFWGGTLFINTPLNKSDYGFSPSTRYQLSMLAMSGSSKFQNIKLGNLSLSSIGLTLTIAHATRSKWNNIGDTPNSKSILYVPGINILISNKNGGGIGINITRGFEEYINDKPSDIKEETDIYGISVSYRKVLDRTIKKLYWK